MRLCPPRWTVPAPLAVALGVAAVALYLVQVSRVLAIGSVNPNLTLVFLVCIAARAPRFWVSVAVGGLLIAAAFLWTPFDVGTVAIAVGIGVACALLAPFLTRRSLADTSILLVGAEIVWAAFVWRFDDPFLTQLRVAGIGFAADAVLAFAVWYVLQRVRAEG